MQGVQYIGGLCGVHWGVSYIAGKETRAYCSEYRGGFKFGLKSDVF